MHLTYINTYSSTNPMKLEKLRHKEFKWLAQHNTAEKWNSQDLKQAI